MASDRRDGKLGGVMGQLPAYSIALLQSNAFQARANLVRRLSHVPSGRSS